MGKRTAADDITTGPARVVGREPALRIPFDAIPDERCAITDASSAELGYTTLIDGNGR